MWQNVYGFVISLAAVHVPKPSCCKIHWGDTWSSFSSATAFQRVYGERRHAAVLNRQKSGQCLEMHSRYSRRSRSYEYLPWFWWIAWVYILVLLSQDSHLFFSLPSQNEIHGEGQRGECNFSLEMNWPGMWWKSCLGIQKISSCAFEASTGLGIL